MRKHVYCIYLNPGFPSMFICMLQPKCERTLKWSRDFRQKAKNLLSFLIAEIISNSSKEYLIYTFVQRYVTKYTKQTPFTIFRKHILLPFPACLHLWPNFRKILKWSKTFGCTYLNGPLTMEMFRLFKSQK